MNYYEHHLGDYLRDTAHLTMLEDGAYRRLLDAYYIRETPLPAAPREVYRLVRAASKQDREAVDTVLREFFTEGPDGWRHSRCDREIERFQGKQAKARASAEARWAGVRSQGESNANASANAMRTHSEGNAPRARPQSPVPSHQPSSKAAGGGSAASADPAPTQRSLALPPPDFDGTNAEALNGKAVVLLAAGWELPEEWGHDGVALGWSPREVLLEAEKFRQYWTAGKGAGTRRAVKGWRQTWSNWLAKAAERRR